MTHPTPVRADDALTLAAVRRSSDFVAGLTAPASALRHLVARPGLWTHSGVAAALHLASFGLVAWLTAGRATDALAALWTTPDAGWQLALWRVASWIVIGVALVISYFVAAIVAQILLAPLNDRLSERVERAVLGGESEAFHWRRFLGDVGQGVAHSIANLALFAVLFVAVLAMNLVPGVGSIAATVAGVTLSASFAAVEFTDWPQARRRMPWRAKWGLARREWRLYLGLGLGLHAMLAVPVVNLLLLPVAVTAGTLVFCGLERAGRLQA